MPHNLDRPPAGQELKPIFLEELFHFARPDDFPDHYNVYPDVPSYIGQWAVLDWPPDDITDTFALDVTSAEQAELLADAKKRYLVSTADSRIDTRDIYILHPDGTMQIYYSGRTQT